MSSLYKMHKMEVYWGDVLSVCPSIGTHHPLTERISVPLETEESVRVC
jgi:hypothetical protein